MYTNKEKLLFEEIEELISEIYLDEDNITQRKRLEYAIDNGLDEVMELFLEYTIHTNLQAIEIINTQLPSMYSINLDYITDLLDIPIHNDSDIKNLLDKYQFRTYDEATNRAHLHDEIRKEMEKMVKKGYGIDKMQKRMQQLFNKSKNSAIRIARTETTRIQNAGRFEAFEEAEKLGLDVKKQWVATKDNRTRDSHSYAHGVGGEIVELHEAFSNGLFYPGDPNGSLKEICNCRCTIISVVA